MNHLALPPPGGNSNVAGQVEVMELTAASQRDRLQHQQVLLDIEAKKRAFQIDVPTLPHAVSQALRNLGLPIRLFGENLANVRDRLRMELARREVLAEQGGGMLLPDQSGRQQKIKQEEEEEEEEITKYSRAPAELIRAREQFAKHSLERGKLRLDKERNYRIQFQRKRARLTSIGITSNQADEDDDEAAEKSFVDVTRLDDECLKTYKEIKNYGLEGSQYGDARPISSIVTSHNRIGGIPLIATGSWSGTIKVWDGSTSELNLLSQKTMAHEDRIMGVALQPVSEDAEISSTLLATASIDMAAKLWKINASVGDDDEPSSKFQIQEVAHLKGHARRLSKVAFHPQGQHLATTSHDHTWRLWDVETGSEILLQDGHWKEVYGVGFHPDGSLCSTTDYGGVVQCWDLRTGKSIHHFLGHAKRVLCAEFSPNGFQLATAGDDGFIKVWDLRKRKQFASIPAHSNLVTQIEFDRYHNGEYLVSSSFDATCKVWSTRDWKMLTTMRGHEGKVMGLDLLPFGIVSCGFDKTIKAWR
jgi:U4/U6 small nuclear ribonucleoprotein PRP4